MTAVALLWHMHQPYYEDLVTHEHILPWVRLHALKDYYGMAAMLRDFPDVRVTFNLVPSLLVQLEAFAADRADDRYLALGLKPAAQLTDDDRAFILDHFFHAQRQRMIDIYPRYAELLARRGGTLPTAADHRAAAARFSVDDLRDLQVWQKLAWIDPVYLEHDARVGALLAKGRHFSEEDKAVLRAVELEILNKVIPEYRDAAKRGQIEIATSPFYHPILPLLCDTDIYLRTHPGSPMPRRRFVHPEDAAEQLERAAAYHEHLFGRRPRGLWPSEGSVSDAIVPLVARAGFEWMATDEEILAKSVGVAFARGAGGEVAHPELLYAAHALTSAGAHVACAFRDRTLSDLIGFTYASWAAEAAADDFVARLAAAGRHGRDAGSGAGEPTIFVILDGENAWEHFEGGGRPFLRALYSRLARHDELRTVTMAEACRTPARQLTTIFPGSWIDANFYIWIGHADDQRAWSQLADAREELERADRDGGNTAAAREEILIAEGSDWFWWYGDDHSSAHDLEFDDLFRRHLRNAYRLLGRPVPDELFVSNISAAARPAADTEPSALLTPTIDGEVGSYFEWLYAGQVDVSDAAGAMHQGERHASVVRAVRYGCDLAALYVRVDAAQPMVDLLAAGYECSLKFLQPDGVRYSVKQDAGRLTGRYWDRRDGSWSPRHDQTAARAAAGAVLEVALPLADLGATAGTPLAFFVAIYDPESVERERHPAHRPISLTAPDPSFAARHWSA